MRPTATDLVKLHEPFAQAIDFIAINYSSPSAPKLQSSAPRILRKAEGRDEQLLPWTMSSRTALEVFPMIRWSRTQVKRLSIILGRQKGS